MVRKHRLETYSNGQLVSTEETNWSREDYLRALSILDAKVSREKEDLVGANIITLPQELLDIIAEKEALRSEMDSIE